MLPASTAVNHGTVIPEMLWGWKDDCLTWPESRMLFSSWLCHRGNTAWPSLCLAQLFKLRPVLSSPAHSSRLLCPKPPWSTSFPRAPPLSPYYPPPTPLAARLPTLPIISASLLGAPTPGRHSGRLAQTIPGCARGGGGVPRPVSQGHTKGPVRRVLLGHATSCLAKPVPCSTR